MIKYWITVQTGKSCAVIQHLPNHANTRCSRSNSNKKQLCPLFCHSWDKNVLDSISLWRGTASKSPVSWQVLPTLGSQQDLLLIYLWLPASKSRKVLLSRAEICEANKVSVNQISFPEKKKVISIAHKSRFSQTEIPILVLLYYFKCSFDMYISETKLNFLFIRNNLQDYLATFTPCKCFLVVKGSWGSPAPVILCQHQPFHMGRSPEKIMGRVKSAHLKSPFLWCTSGVQRAESIQFCCSFLHFPFKNRFTHISIGLVRSALFFFSISWLFSPLVTF